LGYGTLYLIPAPLGPEGAMDASLPPEVVHIARSLTVFIVERPKSARAFLKRINIAGPLSQLSLHELSEHTPADALPHLLQPLLSGNNVGLISEAGCPAVADPGAHLVRLAHERGIPVAPMVGPSSILLALMGSGLNGQRFAFHGYLPAKVGEREKRIGELEKLAAARDETQIFIESPYRNAAMIAALLRVCRPDTLLCLAVDLTLASQYLLTRTIGEWRKMSPPELRDRPTVFLLYRGTPVTGFALT
jgi:16S rRNA (cytidine1402-2'-O)-methyltransferase